MTSRYYSQDKSLIFKIKTILAEVKIFFFAVNLELCKAIPYFPTFLIKKFYALPPEPMLKLKLKESLLTFIFKMISFVHM